MKHPTDQKGIGKRVESLINERKEAPTLFAGLNNIGKKLNGKVSWTHRDIEKICRHTSVSEEWLTSGEGDKYQPLSQISERMEKYGLTPPEGNMYVETRPRIPLKAAAGNIREWYAGKNRHLCEQKPLVLEFQTYQFTLLVYSNSMKPYINTGDIIACTEIPRIISYGDIYILDTEGEVLIRRVFEADEQPDKYRLVPDNKEYPEILIDRASVKDIYRVVGILRGVS